MAVGYGNSASLWSYLTSVFVFALKNIALFVLSIRNHRVEFFFYNVFRSFRFCSKAFL